MFCRKIYDLHFTERVNEGNIRPKFFENFEKLRFFSEENSSKKYCYFSVLVRADKSYDNNCSSLVLT